MARVVSLGTEDRPATVPAMAMRYARQGCHSLSSRRLEGCQGEEEEGMVSED